MDTFPGSEAEQVARGTWITGRSGKNSPPSPHGNTSSKGCGRYGTGSFTMWSKYYQNTISELLQNSLVQLCLEHVPYKDKLEIDGIVCISTGETDKQIIVKMHEIVDRACHDMWHLSTQVQEESSISPVPLKKHKYLYSKSDNQFLDSNPAKRLRYDVSIPSSELKPKDLSQHACLSKSPSPKPGSPSLDPVKDSAEEAAYLSFRECSPYRSMLAYRKRPQRQRVPLTEELENYTSSEMNCKQCPEKFTEFESLEKHNQDAHGRCTCRSCYNTFSLPCNLRRHERLHTGLKPFSCRTCHTSFSRNGDLRAHVGKHKGSQTCQQCSVLFESAGELQNHDCPAEGEAKQEIRSDAERDSFLMASDVSQDSSSNFPTSYSTVEVMDEEEVDHQLEWDRETDPKYPPVQNNIQYSLKHDSKLAALLTSDVDSNQGRESPLVRSTEIEKNESQVKISNLATTFPADQRRSTDLSSALMNLSSSINSFPLNQENRKSPFSMSYTGEESSSYPGTPVSGSDTPKSAKKSKQSKKLKTGTSSPVISKTNIDPNNREHFCRDCGIKWPDFEMYEIHCVERHIRFPCKYCEQTFSNKNNRGRHERTHTGHKQHVCVDCGKCFTRSDTLKEHRITHTEAYYGNKCFCGAVIEKKSDLLAHVKKCLQKKKQEEKLTANLLTPENYKNKTDAKNSIHSEIAAKLKPSPNSGKNFVITSVGGLSQIQQVSHGTSLLKPLDLIKREPTSELDVTQKEVNEETESMAQIQQAANLLKPLDLIKREPDKEANNVLDKTSEADSNSSVSPSGRVILIQPMEHKIRRQPDLIQDHSAKNMESVMGNDESLKITPNKKNDSSSVSSEPNSMENSDIMESSNSPIVVSTETSLGKVHIISSLLRKPIEENANEIRINSNLFPSSIVEENGNDVEENKNLKKVGSEAAADSLSHHSVKSEPLA